MTMTTTEIAAKYFELCSQGENSEAKVLYSPGADQAINAKRLQNRSPEAF